MNRTCEVHSLFGGSGDQKRELACNRNRNVVVWWWRLLASTFLLVVFSSPLSANSSFPHGVVGTAGSIRAVTIIELVADSQSGGGQASGILRFFDPSGDPIQLKVTGEGLQDFVSSQLTFVLGPVAGRTKARYEVESVDNQQLVFWVEVLEQSGAVIGKIQFDLYDQNQLSTSVPVPSAQSQPVTTLSARQTPFVKTGIAIANPANSDATYWVVALDRQQNFVEIRKHTLTAKGQIAQFVNQFFLGLDPDFDGFVSVVSNRNLAVMGLEQNGLELSTTTGISPLHLPFLVGRLEDYLNREVRRSPDFLVSSANLTVTRGTTIHKGSVSPDGNYLVGPLSGGTWQVHVDAPGFLSFEQPQEFPRRPGNIEITNLSFINPTWLNATLASNTNFEGMVVRPDLALNFFFDTSEATGSGLINSLRLAFKQWVVTQLPQLEIPVDNELGETVNLGGATRYQELDQPPSAGLERTVVLTPNAALESPAKATVFVHTVDTTSFGSVLVAGKRNSQSVRSAVAQPGDPLRVIRAALLEYNPDKLSALGSEAEQVAEVARTFWASVFLRTEAADDLSTFAVSGLSGETEKLTPINTIMARSPQAIVSTPYDSYYWEMLRRRPIGTIISVDGEMVEILPKE